MVRSRNTHVMLCFFVVCLALIVGIVWVWRGVLVERFHVDKEPIEVVQEVDVEEKLEDQKTKKLKDSENSLSVFRSSSFKAVDNTEKIVLPTELPSSVNLSVPFTSQAPEKNWEQPWQDACEEAAVLMLDAYYKKYGLSPLFAKDELIKMVNWGEAQGWGLSIEIEKLEQMAEHFSTPKKFNIIENPTVEQIKQFIADGTPVLVVADGKTLPNPHYQNGGPEYHALIIRGYTPDKFITNDPGTQFGQNFTYTYDALMNSIHDWNGGDVKHGRKVVLVAE